MRRDERGAAATEWVLVAPVLLMIACVLVAGARLALARQHLTDAAGGAARAATLRGSAGEGDAAARAMLQANVHGCELTSTSIDVSALRQPPGTPGEVRVALTCRVGLGDLLVPGLPGAISVEARADAPVDTYARRGR